MGFGDKAQWLAKYVELMRYVQLSASQIVCNTGVETLFVSLGLNCPIIEASKLSLLKCVILVQGAGVSEQTMIESKEGGHLP